MCSRLPAADEEGQCKTFKWAAAPHQWLYNQLDCVVNAIGDRAHCLSACVYMSYQLQNVGTSLYSSSDDHQDQKQQSKHTVTGGLGRVIAVRKLRLSTRIPWVSWLNARMKVLVLLDRWLSRGPPCMVMSVQATGVWARLLHVMFPLIRCRQMPPRTWFRCVCESMPIQTLSFGQPVWA